MEAKLSFLSPKPVSPNAGEALPAATGAEAKAPATEFSEVLTGQMFKTQRQGIAASSIPSAGLQVVPLGKSINVITSDAPLPDMASLASFARAQGLDEAAVQALFGPLPSTKDAALAPAAVPSSLPTLGPTLVLATAQSLATALSAKAMGVEDDAGSDTTPLAITTDATPNNTLALAAEGDSVAENDQILPDTAAGGDSPAQPSALAIPGASAVAVVASGGAQQKAPLAVATLVTAPVQSAAPALGHIQPLDRVAVTALEITAASSAPLMPLSARAWIDAAPTAKISDPMSQAQAGTESAVRLTLGTPAQEITKRLAQMSGTSKQVSWAALLQSAAVSKEALDAPIAQEILQLDVPAGFQFDAKDLAAQTEPGLQAPASAAANNTGAAGTLAPGEKPSLQTQLEQRAAQFQQMADKLGEAAAQRLIAQIERGQWKMQMRMQPGSLGRIDVQLEMHSGGLDALFSSDNAVTRELIAQGTNKLKDTLAQSGMAVASVWVNADQGRQSGGNSTPGQAYKGPQNAPNSPAPAQAVATAPDELGSKGSDGLNILA